LHAVHHTGVSDHPLSLARYLTELADPDEPDWQASPADNVPRVLAFLLATDASSEPRHALELGSQAAGAMMLDQGLPQIAGELRGMSATTGRHPAFEGAIARHRDAGLANAYLAGVRAGAPLVLVINISLTSDRAPAIHHWSWPRMTTLVAATTL